MIFRYLFLYNTTDVFRGSLFTKKETANAIYDALTMSDNEKEAIHEALLTHVMHHTGSSWAASYLNDLAKVARDVQARFRLDIPHLSIDTCAQHCEKASHRICILNYDGVLFAYQRRRRQPDESNVALDPYLKRLLLALTERPNMIVIINSGMSRAAIGRLFSAIPALGLSYLLSF